MGSLWGGEHASASFTTLISKSLGCDQSNVSVAFMLTLGFVSLKSMALR